MSSHPLQRVILFSVVCLWTAESTDLFACSLFKVSDVCSLEIELEYDQDDLEAEGLSASLASGFEEVVLTSCPADCSELESELLNVSRWHLRGPPLG